MAAVPLIKTSGIDDLIRVVSALYGAGYPVHGENGPYGLAQAIERIHREWNEVSGYPYAGVENGEVWLYAEASQGTPVNSVRHLLRYLAANARPIAQS